MKTNKLYFAEEFFNTEDSQGKDPQQNQEGLFLYHTPSASLWPYREEHYMLVDMDCARLLRLLRKRLSYLPEHEMQLHLSYLEGVFEGSAMQRQQRIEQLKKG